MGFGLGWMAGLLDGVELESVLSVVYTGSLWWRSRQVFFFKKKLARLGFELVEEVDLDVAFGAKRKGML